MKFYPVLLITIFSLSTTLFSQVEFIPHTITTSASAATSVFAVEVDGDGDLDVLSASSRDNKIAWYKNFNPLVSSVHYDAPTVPNG